MEEITQPTPATNENLNPHKGLNLLKIGFIAVLLLFLSSAFLSIYLLITNTELKNQLDELKEPTNTTNNNVFAPPDSTLKETETIDPGTPSHIIMEDWTVYIDPYDKFEITNPGEWLLFTNDYKDYLGEISRLMNFRHKTDERPVDTGFYIRRLKNPKYETLKEMCDENEFNDEISGIYCSDNIVSIKVIIGSTEWEKFEDGAIDIVPGRKIILSTYHNNKIFFIVDNGGYGFEKISEVLSTFRPIE
jgi:hypothetical protein